MKVKKRHYIRNLITRNKLTVRHATEPSMTLQLSICHSHELLSLGTQNTKKISYSVVYKVLTTGFLVIQKRSLTYGGPYLPRQNLLFYGKTYFPWQNLLFHSKTFFSKAKLTFPRQNFLFHGKTYFSTAKLTFQRQNLLFHGKTYFSTAKLTLFLLPASSLFPLFRSGNF